jgi:hypothetical protein
MWSTKRQSSSTDLMDVQILAQNRAVLGIERKLELATLDQLRLWLKS